AEEIGELAADGEPEPGAAVAPAGAGIGLLEGLEDDLLLLEGNADAGVADLESDHRWRLPQDRVIRVPSSRSVRYAQSDAAALGELEGIGEEVLEDLLQAFCIRNHAVELRIELDGESQLAVVGLVAERPCDRVDQLLEHDLLGFDGDRAG